MRPWRHRPFCIALLLYQALWLNAVVPGHTRGAVPLPGADPCAACLAPPSNSLRPADPAHDCCPRDRRPSLPAGGPSHCAICYFAAVLMVPPAVDLAPTPLGLLRRLPPLAPAAAPEARPLAAYYTRGPPAGPATSC